MVFMEVCFRSASVAALAPTDKYPDPARQSTALRRRPLDDAWCGGPAGIECGMYTLLWIVAVILVIAGVFGIVRGQVIWGIALIVAGLLIGPGGVSVLT